MINGIDINFSDILLDEKLNDISIMPFHIKLQRIQNYCVLEDRL